MTTFQDPPAQSRRAARQSERGERPDTPTPFGQPSDAPPKISPDPLDGLGGYSTPQPQNVAPQVAPATGRRARPVPPQGLVEVPPPVQRAFPTGQTGYPEPLTYSTQGIQQAQPAAPPVAPPVPPPSYSQSQADEAAFRVRDFSPEGGRRAAAPATPPPLVEPQAWQPGVTASYSPPSDLDYQTQASPFGGGSAQRPPQPQVPPFETAQQQSAQQQSAPQNYVSPTPPMPTLVTPPVATMPTPAPPTAGSVPTSAPPTAAPVPAPAPTAEIHTLSRKELRALRAEEEAASPFAQTQTQPSALENAMAEFEALTQATKTAPPQASQRVDEAAPIDVIGVPAPKAPYTAPVGHWSRQADLEDETQPYENTITREVGVSNLATTTSALVLPSIPNQNDFPTALNSTGEILFTGSIELPKSLGSIGGDSRRYDDPNVDLFFDSQDSEVAATDSAPVKAISAISTHTSARGVIHASKPKGGRMLTVLLITASILAVGVAALLAAGFIFHII